MTENKLPTEDQVLTASLKLVIDRFVEMGYEENIIFGKVNLVLNDFITPEGTFTKEYIELAERALKMRASKEFESALMTPDRPEISLVMPGGIGGVRRP